MIRRTNKITSLLLATAAVVSMVPAYAADIKKVDTEVGTVYNAIAYKDGKDLVNGKIKDNEGTYYYVNGKYTNLNDIDSGSDYTIYGTKYAEVENGDYYVDLDTGKVTKDSMRKNDLDDAESSLRKKIKEVNRYNSNSNLPTDFIKIAGNKFSENWYATKFYTIATNLDNAGDKPTIYTDAKGNYIDADYNLGKIKVETTGSGVSGEVTVENTVDKKILKSGSTTIATVDAKIVNSATKELGQDKDNIYRYTQVKITLTPANGITLPSSVKINGKIFAVDASNHTVILDTIQKISKAQNSDTIKDAKYAKSVSNYIISNDNGSVLSNESNYLALAKVSGTEARVIGEKLVLFNINNTKGSDPNLKIQAATLKGKNGYYYTDVEKKADIKAEYSTDINKAAIDTDIEGNIYILDSGYIKKFDGTDDWTKIYKVDGAFDSLSVYDNNNMITWSQHDEVYSVIGGKKQDDNPTPTPNVTKGWVKATDGTWSYNKADGTKTIGWFQDGNGWYYTNGAGVMQTGWQYVGGLWYYLNPVSDGNMGAMKTGWQNIGGTWYYLNPISNGAMGAMKTGWINDNGTWYYCNSSGAMLADTVVNGYVLGKNGAWIR
ncbi:hypothetical protein B0P06_002520 [Clostridium saccharoperbutylacetonicum]|uniref:Cell wall binding repeat-containing protein n=1 Tax=Clostridium saccharoperbutylacetonicum N1-4(HMT) TaxID=931276 RepID=M1MX48_9CLOT|nr:N-acetylmuramoyl-L-alanine amidase family protein [Clostridium saccharoperbutylacetonicum]AGF59146.1 hypothetical protein Cspa_c54010 [Clostridium saccharoperbutylacetonicum N1-4(HMT)]NRT60067.1 hypothetical protein [Clostridium saccharoperbutylacetonicum]NSB23379.1 hypothetical protein [Clostridium saccharoperbutylacetonicum]NSB42749.1 hypothetical protein [Clostridium saccharoperbutylacetonicum]